MSRMTEPEPRTVPDGETRDAATMLSEAEDEPQIDEELLIEEISIDGMCGVY